MQHLINTITCIDALELLASLEDASIDMILTSPPYDSLRSYSDGYSFDFESIAKESFRVLKTGGVLVWIVDDAFVNGSETLTSFRQALYFVDICGFNMHQRLIWEKNGLPRKRPNAYIPDFEDMFVLSKGEPKTFNPIMRKNKNAGQVNKKGKSAANGFYYESGVRAVADFSIDKDVWIIGVGDHASKDKAAYEHPAIFPEELARRHIHTWSNEGDIVLDYFSGSGTTAKIARNMNRRYIAGDISAEYVELAKRRLANTDPMQHSILKDGRKQLSLFANLDEQK